MTLRATTARGRGCIQMDVGHQGAERLGDDERQRISRRRFISVAAAGTLVGTAGASLLLSACQPQAPAGQPSAPAASGSGAPASSGAPARPAAKDPFPTY